MRRFQFAVAVAFIVLGVWISIDRLLLGLAFGAVGLGSAIHALRTKPAP